MSIGANIVGIVVDIGASRRRKARELAMAMVALFFCIHQNAIERLICADAMLSDCY